MESLKLLIIVLFFSTTVIKSLSEGGNVADSAKMIDDFTMFNTEEIKPHSLRGLSRILAQKIPQNYTCNTFPRVCRLKGSPGPDCCKKKCVNVNTDPLNCGICGHKCRYNEICCKKRCVDSRFDRKNCGGCGIKCKKGDVCAFGMCSYA